MRTVGKDSVFNLSMMQGLGPAGVPRRVVVARLAHIRRCTTFVQPGLPNFLIMRCSVGAVAEQVPSRYDHDVSLVRLGRLPRSRDSAVDSSEESAASYLASCSSSLLSQRLQASRFFARKLASLQAGPQYFPLRLTGVNPLLQCGQCRAPGLNGG